MATRLKITWLNVLLGAATLIFGASGAFATITCDLSASTDSSCTLPTDSSSGGAIFANPANVDNVGSGVINPFLTVQKDGTESGFSTDIDGNDLPLNDKRNNSNTFTNTFALSDLDTFVDPNTNTSYYEFFLDVNEPDNDPSRLISLDYLRIYDSGSTAPMTLGGSTTLAQLDSAFGPALYNLGANGVLLNYDLFKGSGNGYDMSLLIPISVFTGVNTSNRIVFANTFGSSGGTTAGADTADGFEEWAYLKGEGTCPAGSIGTPPDCTVIPPEEIPEPAILSLLGVALLGLGVTTLRRRA